MSEHEVQGYCHQIEEIEHNYPDHINAQNRNNPLDFVTPWLALTSSNLENSCMSMIPGIHKKNIQKHHDTFEETNILTRGQAVKDVVVSSVVDLILKPGQMSLHHAEIIHDSQPNLSNDRRIGYAMQAFMPAHAQ
jgi:non-heme Fe2+,alpha-ketoglutarate-dependent halogenase